MYSRVSFVVRTLVVATAGFALLLVGLSQASAAEEGMAAAGNAAQTEADDGEPIIRATARISIPYGFDLALPLMNDGDSVVASGEGHARPMRRSPSPSP